MKKITFLMAMIFAMMTNINAGTRTIYLDANIWNVDGAVFAAWAWNANDEGAAYKFTSVEGSIYKTEVNDDAVAIIFLRQDPTKADAENIWDSEWNRAQTGIPADQNMFTVTSWEDPWGTWSTYGAAVNPDPTPNPAGTRTIYLDANIWTVDNPIFAAWAWNANEEGAAYEFTKVEGSVYKTNVKDDAVAIIFLRKDPAAVDPTDVWAGVWNRAQTGIDADKNMFKITSWGDENGCVGAWLNYGDAVEYETFHLYVNNQTTWEAFDIYAYGNSEAFGGWPGATTAETQVVNDVTYNVYEFQVEKGIAIELNLIIHNNIGENVEGDKRLYFTITEARDYYLIATDEAVTEGTNTAIEDIQVESMKEGKMIYNGQLYVIKNGHMYNILGTIVK